MGDCHLSWDGTIDMNDFHNLTLYCRNVHFSVDLATFIIQLVRCSLLISLMAVLLPVYNTIIVMDRHILSTATCSLYWVFMFLMMTLKSGVLVAFPTLATNFNSSTYNMAGFIMQAIFQSAAVFLLFVALDHERRFRSSEFATVDTPSKYCFALSFSKQLFFSWPRVVALILTLLPIIVLITIEVMFSVHRLACIVLGVVLVKMTKVKLAPSILSKVFLITALLLSLMEDYPNFATGCITNLDCQEQLQYLTIYDLLQLIGSGSFIFFALFIRSQYLRIEQESKLNLMMELQKLLQVNGRKNIIRHYT